MLSSNIACCQTTDNCYIICRVLRLTVLLFQTHVICSVELDDDILEQKAMYSRCRYRRSHRVLFVATGCLQVAVIDMGGGGDGGG